MRAQSYLSPIIDGYIRYRKASGRDSYSYIKNVILFEHFCTREYSAQAELTQEMVDKWCRQRGSESTNSCVSRIYPILDFIKYMKKRGLTNINLPQVPKSVPRTYIPHAFTRQELERFFNACDNSFCNQIVTVGEYFGRFCTLLTYSEKTCKYKTKVS